MNKSTCGTKIISGSSCHMEFYSQLYEILCDLSDCTSNRFVIKFYIYSNLNHWKRISIWILVYKSPVHVVFYVNNYVYRIEISFIMLMIFYTPDVLQQRYVSNKRSVIITKVHLESDILLGNGCSWTRS